METIDSGLEIGIGLEIAIGLEIGCLLSITNGSAMDGSNC